MIRVRRMRLDLFICFVIALAIYSGMFLVAEKLHITERIGNVISSVGHSRIQEVPDGEVGGYATDDVTRVYSADDLVNCVMEGKTFTTEVSPVKYYNMGTFVGDNYEWRILKLDDGSCFAVRINSDKIIENGTKHILPVGRVVEEEPEVLDEMMRAMENAEGNFCTNVYIDMDGEANASKTGVAFGVVKIIGFVMLAFIPFLAFAVLILLVFGIHRIFVECHVFPPVFQNGKW